MHRLLTAQRFGLIGSLAALSLRSPFDAENFLSTTVDGPMATVVQICDEGEFRAMIDDGDKAITAKTFSGKEGKPDSHQCTILFSILDDGQKARLKRDKVLVPMNVWLDLTDSGALDMSDGKNVGLGRLRKAVGQNDGSWNPAMLKGKGPLMVKVGHRPDQKDPTIKYAEIQKIAPIT